MSAVHLLALLALPLAVVGDRLMDPDFRRRVRARLRARRIAARPKPLDDEAREHWEQVRTEALIDYRRLVSHYHRQATNALALARRAERELGIF